MDDYLTKPLKRETLLGMVEKWTDAILEQSSHSSDKNTLKDMAPDIDALPMDMARALAEFDNDSEFLDQVLAEFLEVVDGQLGKIRTAIDTADFDTIVTETHAIKGGAANLTADALSNAAFTLETLGKDKKAAHLNESLERLTTAFHALVEYTRK